MIISRKLSAKDFGLGCVETYVGKDAGIRATIHRENGVYQCRGFDLYGQHQSAAFRSLRTARSFASKIIRGRLGGPRQSERICKIQDGDKTLEMTFAEIAYSLKLYGEHIEMLKKYNCATHRQLNLQEKIASFI